MFVAYDDNTYFVLCVSFEYETFEEFTDRILAHSEVDMSGTRVARIIPTKFKIVKDEQ